MKSGTAKITDVDNYIAGFPENTKKLLTQIRKVVRKAVPGAEEVISYNMPAYKFYGMLVYFAGYENHIGFYPMPSAIKTFKEDLSVYKTAKGSVQFPLDKPLPLLLITKIIAFRKKENMAKAETKLKTKK